MDRITVSTDKERLNVKFINDFISNSYWGKGISMEETKKCINNSLNFGIYLNENQIGYARIVSDFTIFAYIMDVFIAEAERGKGYSTVLLNEVFSNLKLKEVQNWKLATSDAHSLYKKYGFDLLENPKNMMERKINNF